ncbi:MAG TPA: type II toxin-antitoxin system PemK/MazF family toxin [Fimbriiglobus sp.]|nr:type II toxin-antitoxin system PemK/MazF family toxin [Fimbriiglobus sp.]
MSSPLTQGRIVRVTIRDSQGGNAKTRPAVVVTATAEIAAADVVVVAAITSDLGRARSSETVELPWHPDRHPQTRLRKPSEVVCSWVAAVPVAALNDTGGFVPDDLLPELLAEVERLT